LDLQEHLNRNLIELPLILMTGYGDIKCRKTMKAGAVDFLTKPFEIRTCSMRLTLPWSSSDSTAPIRPGRSLSKRDTIDCRRESDR